MSAREAVSYGVETHRGSQITTNWFLTTRKDALAEARYVAARPGVDRAVVIATTQTTLRVVTTFARSGADSVVEVKS